MYKAPDFVKVSTRINDVFAPYGMCERHGHSGYDVVGTVACEASEDMLFSEWDLMRSQCFTAEKN